MARRSIWSGSISFGLVNIPVKLYTAVANKEVRFHQVHDKDGARIHHKRFCAEEDVEVPWDEIVKGYPVSKHRIVTITREELEAFDPRATRTIDITEFVDLHQIDPVYYERTYYLAPDKGAERAYRLLLEAMEARGRVGIAKVVLRTRQDLCAVRPVAEALMLSTMWYHDEIVPAREIEGLPARAETSEKELAMAEQLIDALAADWNPEKYEDTYRDRLLELISKKAEGEAIEVAPPAEERVAVDLFEALKASLEQGGRAAPRATKRPAGARTRRKRPAA